MSIKPVLNDHLLYMTIFHCSFGRSHKTGLIVHSKPVVYKSNEPTFLYYFNRALMKVPTELLSMCQGGR